LKVALIAGARPNFMKIAPLVRALEAAPGFEPVVVHTGQHYDRALSELFFEELGIPEPAVNFGVGSGSHARQTADVMVAFESWIAGAKPGLVVVVGDVNSTLACGIVAVKAGLPLAHVEAGLRSFDRAMPEEINRILVDRISDLLFVTEPAAVANLRAEGVPPERIHHVGNVMIDTLLAHRERARRSTIVQDLGLTRGHVVATLHRPSNVDDAARLGALLRMLASIGDDSPVVLPLHPRTRARAVAAGLGPLLDAPGLIVTEPLGYVDFVQLMATARAVLTDSGGIQEETTVLGVPCLTIRENTERPITCEEGTNRLVGVDPDAVLAAWRELEASPPAARRPALWDGHAASRIVDVLARWRDATPCVDSNG
jgi:UDP-N-acetylglucosamine 2-epimerase (non-hydrolysing)